MHGSTPKTKQRAAKRALRPSSAGLRRSIAAGVKPSLPPHVRQRIASLSPRAKAVLARGLEAQQRAHLDSLGVPEHGEATGPRRSVKIGGKWYRTDSLGVPQHTPSGFSVGHLLGGIAKGTGKLAEDYVATPFEAAYHSVTGNDKAARAELARHFAAEGDISGATQIAHANQDPLGAALAVGGLVPGVGKFGELLRGEKLTEAAAKVARSVPRTPAQVEEHVAEQATKAAQEGYGRLEPKVPKLEPGQVTAATGGKVGHQLRNALAGKVDTAGMGSYEAAGAKLDAKSAAQARTEQDALRSAERGRRAGAAEAAAAERRALRRKPGAAGPAASTDAGPGGSVLHGDPLAPLPGSRAVAGRGNEAPERAGQRAAYSGRTPTFACATAGSQACRRTCAAALGLHASGGSAGRCRAADTGGQLHGAGAGRSGYAVRAGVPVR